MRTFIQQQPELIVMLCSGAIVLLVGVLLALCQRSHHRKLLTAQVQAELARAQLQTMKAQLQPHFLFNTLNTISVLTTEDPEKANRMIVLLSDLLRQTLEISQADEVTLKHELDLLRAYLEIQRMRFRRRLAVSYDVDAELLEANVPHFSLQPLVENAIRHGIAKRHSGGRINIRAHRMNGSLVLQVQDNGPGLSMEKMRERNGTGIGLANTRKRLSCMYGSLSSVEIQGCTPRGALATIVIPYRENAKRV
jgi:two-component system LytT family sensor kinase